MANPRASNFNGSVGRCGTVPRTNSEAIDAYDQLPREVRNAIGQAVGPIDTVQTLAYLKANGLEKTLATIQRTNEAAIGAPYAPVTRRPLTKSKPRATFFPAEALRLAANRDKRRQT